MLTFWIRCYCCIKEYPLEGTDIYCIPENKCPFCGLDLGCTYLISTGDEYYSEEVSETTSNALRSPYTKEMLEAYEKIYPRQSTCNT
jgi:hypothetical protein